MLSPAYRHVFPLEKGNNLSQINFRDNNMNENHFNKYGSPLIKRVNNNFHFSSF
jgi:hypothetical protein